MSQSTGRKVTPPVREDSPRSRRTLWLVAVGVAAVIVLAMVATQRGAGSQGGSNGAGTSDSAQQTTEQIQLSATGGSEVGDQAPQFSATTTAGDQFEMPPGKPAVIFFMAAWCLTCIPEAQALAEIHDEYGDKVSVLGVDVDPQMDLAMVGKFAQEADAEYGFIRDGDGTLAQALEVQALDTTVVLDAEGRIVFRDAVPTDGETLRDALKEAGLS